jgi:hypothetical protein
MTVQHWPEAGSIGRVAGFDDDVEDEPASPARQVVAILHAAPALYDDVGMRFEQAHQLLTGRNGLAIYDTASGLVDDALDQREVVLGLEPPERHFARRARKALGRPSHGRDACFGGGDQIPVEGRFLLLSAAVPDGERARDARDVGGFAISARCHLEGRPPLARAVS